MKREIGNCIRILPFAFFLVGLGCAGGISRQARSQVTYHGAFSTLQAAPSAYRGEMVLLGGEILNTRNENAGTEIMVLQMPLGGADRPEDADRSEGRFLVRTPSLLDPSVYRKGTRITVVGRLSGAEVRAIGEANYLYPALDAFEIKHWAPQQRPFPNLFFGVGVAGSF